MSFSFVPGHLLADKTPNDCPSATTAGSRHESGAVVGQNHQSTIFDAIACGRSGMERATQAAERVIPDFRTRAEAAILQHLAACPDRQAAGEDLVDIARAHGAECKDARAFGSVFQSLSRRGLIRTVGFTLRKKGHGTAGGRIWRLNA